MIQSNNNELAHDLHPRQNSDNEWQISIVTISVGEGEGRGVGMFAVMEEGARRVK